MIIIFDEHINLGDNVVRLRIADLARGKGRKNVAPSIKNNCNFLERQLWND